MLFFIGYRVIEITLPRSMVTHKRFRTENDDKLKVDINHLVTTTCSSSAMLMIILSEHGMKEISMVLKDYLR